MDANPYESPRETDQRPLPGDYSGCLYLLLIGIFVVIVVAWGILPAICQT